MAPLHMRRVLIGAATISVALAAPLSFIADTSAQQVPLTFAILDCVGTGHAALALRSDYRAHLAAVQRDIGFRSVRGHGILDDDLSTFLDGEVNMINVYSILDFYLSVGIKPTLELSFMPEELAANASFTIMHYKGITSTPADPVRWSNFIFEFASLLIARYGAAEVRSWRFEVGVGA
jgi:xylan 1,4-beta-xylosidase